jgi:hypothetical protein
MKLNKPKILNVKEAGFVFKQNPSQIVLLNKKLV